MAPEQKIAIIILTNRTGSSLPKTASAALEMLLPFGPKSEPTDMKRRPLTEGQMSELAGAYSNNRQTVELIQRDGRIVARRSGAEAAATAGSFAWAGKNRLGLYAGEESDRPSNTYFVLRDSAGRPEYLINGSRAFKRK